MWIGCRKRYVCCVCSSCRMFEIGNRKLLMLYSFRFVCRFWHFVPLACAIIAPDRTRYVHRTNPTIHIVVSGFVWKDHFILIFTCVEFQFLITKYSCEYLIKSKGKKETRGIAAVAVDDDHGVAVEITEHTVCSGITRLMMALCVVCLLKFARFKIYIIPCEHLWPSSVRHSSSL